MAIVAHSYSFVIAVDTHARTHTYAIVKAATGELVDTQAFPTTKTGLDRAIAWAQRRTSKSPDTLWVVEGVASYGAQLARAVTDADYQVVEAPRMNARTHHGEGKSDPLDAKRIAAATLPLNTKELRHPRADDGVRAALRVLATARDHMTAERTATINALLALLRVVHLGIDTRRALTNTQVAHVAGWRARTEDLAKSTARTEAIRLAKRILNLDEQLTTNKATLEALVRQSQAAPLLNEPGIGPVTAATILMAWSHPGRVRNEAAFAALAGVNPIPASSGNTTRHRLNRAGDRRLNRALHIIIVTRMTHDPKTKAYVQKRTTEGRTTKEIRRTLKRYLARHTYRTLNNPQPTP